MPPADWGAQLTLCSGRTWHAWDVARTMWAVRDELLQVKQKTRGVDMEPGCLAQEYTAKLGALQAKGDDYDIAAAQIGVEVYSAMNAAMGQ